MIYPELSFADYRALEGLNCSSMKALSRSPAHYRHEREHPAESTPTQILGQAVHARVLEPASFLERFCYAPTGDRRTKAGKAAHERHAAENGGKIPLPSDAEGRIESMAAAVHGHPVAGPLLAEGQPEVSATGELLGELVKARYDWLRQGEIVDLKTTQCADPATLGQVMARYSYHRQAAFYTDIAVANDLAVAEFLFVFVENEPPFGVAVIRPDAEALLVGRREYLRLLQVYAEAQLFGEWPSYAPAVHEVALPRWALRDTAGACE